MAGEYTTNDIFYLPAGEEDQSTGKPLFDAAMEVADGMLFGTIEHHTADDTLTQIESGSIHTNLGEDSEVTLTLPKDAEAGCKFFFVVMVAQELRIVNHPDTTGAIYINGAKQTDDKYITANAINESVMLVADGNGDWVALFTTGTWTVET